MTEQRERIADAAEAWARAVQRYEDADRYVCGQPTRQDRTRLERLSADVDYARANLLQACGKVGA